MVCFARCLSGGTDGKNGIDGERRDSKFREIKEFKEIKERLSLNSLIYHLNQRTNFLLEGVRFGLSQK